MVVVLESNSTATDKPVRPKAAAPRQKIGHNDPCPCGSGKTFKKCCGDTGEPTKKATGGRLADTLDRTLKPRIAPGKPGRPAGAGNYDWTPEMDKRLIEFWTKCGRGGTAPPGGWLAFAKEVMASRLMEPCPREPKPREDSLRRAVERRMAFLDYLPKILAKRRSLTRLRKRRPGPVLGPPFRSPHCLDRSAAI